MEIKVIGSRNIVNLFRLIGIDGKTPLNKEETIKFLEEFIREEKLVIISYSIRKKIENEISEFRRRKLDFILLEIPDPEGEMPGIKEIQKLLEEVVGIKI